MLIELCEFEVSRGGHPYRLQPTPHPTVIPWEPFHLVFLKSNFILGNRVITVMAEEDFLVPASTVVPFIDTRQIEASKSFF